MKSRTFLLLVVSSELCTLTLAMIFSVTLIVLLAISEDHRLKNAYSSLGFVYSSLTVIGSVWSMIGFCWMRKRFVYQGRVRYYVIIISFSRLYYSSIPYYLE